MQELRHLCSEVVGEVVVDDQTEEAIEKRQVNLFVHSCKGRLDADYAVSFRSVPDIGQIIHAQTPLVNQQRRWLSVRRLDPAR